MKYLPTLGRLKTIFERALIAELATPSGTPGALTAAMRYAVMSGGKRIRPLVVLASARACGAPWRSALRPAVAIELIHTYSLVHDDLPAMDDDDLRRGKPTVHKKFDEATAILAGDALLTKAFGVLASHPNDEEAKEMAMVLARSSGTSGMVGGQMLDIACSRADMSGRTIERIHRLKTAALFEAAGRLGAIAAGAAKPRIERLGRFGLFFGLSFQVVDDLLDRGAYVRRFGSAAARRSGIRLAEAAIEALKPFGARAEMLRGLARAVAKRTE